MRKTLLGSRSPGGEASSWRKKRGGGTGWSIVSSSGKQNLSTQISIADYFDPSDLDAGTPAAEALAFNHTETT
eukprot:COSAG03_NODE_23648_length_278_cov_0.687151_1_plen_72_part_10